MTDAATAPSRLRSAPSKGGHPVRGGRPSALPGGGPFSFRAWRTTTVSDSDAHHEMSCFMRNKRSAATLIRLLQHARYEVLPTASTEDKVLEHLPRDAAVTVTASPGKGLEATLDLAERLTGHGYVVVPHLAARMVTGRTELEEIARPARRQGHQPGLRARRRRRPGGRLSRRARAAQDLRASGRRSPTSASPATRSPTRRSTTTSPCSRCGTSAATPPTSSAT